MSTEMSVMPVDEAQIPSVIQSEFGELQRYRSYVERSAKKADSAMKSAKGAQDKSAGLFQKKAAIEALQTAVVDNAEALGTFAEAQGVSFEYQRKLAEFCKYLFGIGVSNIAANRSVVRELELKLKGASQEELDDFARQEIYGVLRQLKAQEDIMQKQAKLSDKVKSHDERLGGLEKKSEENTRRIEEQITREVQQDKHDASQDAELVRQASKDAEHDKRLDAGDAKDESQDAELAQRASKDAEHDKRLDAGDAKDESQDAELARQASKDAEHDKSIKELEAKVAELEKTCEQLGRTIETFDSKHTDSESKLQTAINSRFTRGESIASAIVGALGLIAAIIGFFI